MEKHVLCMYVNFILWSDFRRDHGPQSAGWGRRLFWDVWLLLVVVEFLYEGRTLSLGMGRSKDRRLENFRTEHFRASPYTFFLPTLCIFVVGAQRTLPRKYGISCNAEQSDIKKIKIPLKHSYSSGLKIGRDSGISYLISE